MRSGTEGGCCLRAERQTLLKAQGSGFVTHAVFLAWFQSPFACTALPWSLLPKPAGENDGGNCCQPWEHQWLGCWREEMKCQCVEVKVLLKRRTYWSFSTYTQFSAVQQFFACQCLSYCCCTEAHKALNYSMHANKNLLVFCPWNEQKHSHSVSSIWRKAHCSPCAFLSPFPSTLLCCEELLQICCVVCAACSHCCQKCNLCLFSCWQRWIFGKLGRTCMWEGKKYMVLH